MWGGNWVFNNGRREPEDQGVSIAKIKRHDEVRSRIKRYKIIAIGTARIGKVSIFYNSLSIFYNSFWLRPSRKSNQEDQRNIWREGKGIKTFATEGVYCWRWHCCRLNKKLPSEMGVALCWQCLQIWLKLTCRETQPEKIGLRAETPFWSWLWHACIQGYFDLAGI